jgi:pyrimidine deaminase RibD-like protein/riboflavin biosynthesis pyrimidine reductase
MVGAVAVKNGKIVGKGYHRGPGLPHAEVNALKDAGTSAKGATLYVNLEPCCSFGKTPPCTDAIIQAGIKKVVCAIPDPNPKVRGKGIKQLKEKGIKVDVGVLKNEAAKLNEIYLKFIKTKLPFLILSLAQTLDGKLVTLSGDPKDSFPAREKTILKNLKSKVDAVLTQNKVQLNSRKEGSSGEYWKTKKGAKGLTFLLKSAGKCNITSILVEGVKENLTHLLRNELVDKIYYFISAKIVGKGQEPFGDLSIWRISDSIYLKDREVHRFSDNILIVGYPVWRK